ncbi:MAG: EamA family transporter [Coleofasciculus chthonoplastes F3-SA18-01]|uniref:EamA family transporter n=1 Tax=Coleofasciculus chthonoplastes TaxID=64178 RepID=UPI003304F66E
MQIKIVLRSLENFFMNAYFALIISIMIGIGGQLSLKAGAMQGIGSKLFFLQPYILVGLSSYFCASLFYIFALREIPVSVAFPSVSISYVAVAFLAHLIWGEPFGIRQVIALGLIGLGIYTLNHSS